MTVPSCTCAACRWLHPPPPSGLVLGQKQGGVHVPRRSHDAIPICHLADFIHIMCVVTRNLRLGKSPGASCAKKACGNPDRTMLDFRHLSRPPWWMEQRSTGSSTAALHPRRMSANHCLRLVMASPVCHLLHIVGPAEVTSRLPESLILDSQFGWCSFSLGLHR